MQPHCGVCFVTNCYCSSSKRITANNKLRGRTSMKMSSTGPHKGLVISDEGQTRIRKAFKATLLLMLVAAWVCVGAVSASAQCATTGNAWHNASFTSQSGAFTASFDASVKTSSTINDVVVLSQGAQTSLNNDPVIISFSSNGALFSARNGGAYVNSTV